MKTSPLRPSLKFQAITILIANIGLASVEAANPVALPTSFNEIARANFDNVTQTAESNEQAVTTALQGTSLPADDGVTYLSEFSVGHTFAPFTAYGSYATDVVAKVREKLYPDPDATYEQVNKTLENEGAAFRYKVLLFNTDGGTDVTNHFDQINDWYGDDERALIAEQIEILRVALANSPYSAELRNLYLDAHTDRAVAELQFIKQDLVTLAKKRLGLELVDAFIIDEEIRLLESVTQKLKTTLEEYQKLLSDKMGVNPSEIDPSATPGTFFGYYVFQKQQPKRNTVASRYFQGTGNSEQESVPNPTGELPRPVDEVLLSGYKDYTTILKIQSELVTHIAELCRLRGMRQLPAGGSSIGDIETARRDITTYLERVPTDLSLLSAMFTNSTEFYPIDSVTSSTSSTDLYPVSQLIEGPIKGFETEIPYNRLPKTWVTTDPGGAISDYYENAEAPVLIFDLHQDVSISEISIWGYDSITSNSVKRFRLRLATDAEGTANFGSSIKFSPVFEARNVDTARQSFPFGGEFNARYVEVTILDNYYSGSVGGDRVGLGEVAFQKPKAGANDISGVHAARVSVEQALSDLVSIRSFINGDTNMLGLDPDFLVFLQNGNETSDSFEIFVDRIKEDGSNKPLTIALSKLENAQDKYETFRGSVDQVSGELAALQTTYKNRFYNITGYTTVEAGEIITDEKDPRFGLTKWDGKTPQKGSGAELDVVAENIRLLKERLVTYDGLLDLFKVAHSEADVTVSTAKQLDTVIEAAKNDYLDQSGFYYDALAISNATAAGIQATTDAAFATAGLDGASTFFSGGGTAALVGVAGAANIAAQGANAGLSKYFEKEIDSAAFAFQTATQKQDNALTYQQALDAKQDLLREQQGALAESQELLSALTQAQSQKGSLLDELERIKAALEASTDRVRSNYYADPIHFIRSENALLEADSRFREAQRWLFLTQRALEHKWTQSFAIKLDGTSTGGSEKSYDEGSLFKMRNAQELDDLLSAYVQFDNDRTIKFGVPSTTSRYTIISLKNDVLAVNPNRFNSDPTKRTDKGIRVDLATGETVSKDELFRRKLRRSLDPDGLRLRLNTALLSKPGFFVGTQYSTTDTNKVTVPGEWRDKIIYAKVSIVASDHDPNKMPEQIDGSLSYGGMTIFRTPRIPLPQIENRLTLPSDAEKISLERYDPNTDSSATYSQLIDKPGEYITAPYRHFIPSALNFDGDTRNIDKLFQASNSQLANARIAYWDKSLTEIIPSDPKEEDTLGSSFEINDFRELSVAATDWSLFISTQSKTLNIDNIEDIEILIRHRADTRITPKDLQP